MSGPEHLPSNPVVIDLRTLERAVQTGRHYGFQQDIWTRAANEIDRLQSENTTFRNAQKACADCDAPTMERVRQIEAELAEAKRALGRFGRHENSCRFSVSNSPSGLRIVVGCTCGLHAALKEPTT